MFVLFFNIKRAQSVFFSVIASSISWKGLHAELWAQGLHFGSISLFNTLLSTLLNGNRLKCFAALGKVVVYFSG